MGTGWNGDFKSKYEFKDTVARGGEIVFEWNEIEYGIFLMGENKWIFGKQNSDNLAYYNSLDELMNAKIDGYKLIDICTKFTVIDRSL